MSYNINDICRVCLVPTTSRRNSNLFFSSGRSVQLWAKVMACAWVQVFEGDGLPSQICYKCHNKLDIAYQFKQQCEAADAQIRQFLNRTVSNKGSPNNIDVIQNQDECLAECKPLNFNITSECLDLVQSDLSLSTYRLMSQDVSLTQQIDFRIRENDFAAMKQEPGLIASLNLYNPLPLAKGDCQIASSFKCESFNESDIMLDSLPAKLFESVEESVHQTSEAVRELDSKIWDLHQKDQIPPASKTDYGLINENKEFLQHKDKEIVQNISETEDLSFLADDRCVSPIVKNYISCVLEEQNTVINSELHHLDPPISNKDVKEISQDTVITELNKDEKNKKKTKIDDNSDVGAKVKKEFGEQCELCGKIFKYRNYMIQHLRTHTGAKPYSCSHCDQKFSMYHILAAHLRIHSGDRPFICAVCGKTFNQISALKCHMNTHTGEKPFECEICHKKFSLKSNLLTHKTSHSGKREHVCTVCNVAFKLYKHLQSHMKTHSDYKEFKCSICQKRFRRKTYLRTHLAIHGGEKPYKCVECGHNFSDSSNFRAHMRIHSGVKLYKCEVCKKSFAQSSGLNRHMQQHSSINPC